MSYQYFISIHFLSTVFSVLTPGHKIEKSISVKQFKFRFHGRKNKGNKCILAMAEWPNMHGSMEKLPIAMSLLAQLNSNYWNGKGYGMPYCLGLKPNLKFYTFLSK